MADKKSNLIEEAIAEFKLIESALNSNAKEILRSVAKEEITSTLNESLNEDEYDIEDIEDDNGDVDALPVGAPEEGGDDLGLDSMDDSEMGDSEMGGADELGIDDMGLDSEGSEDYETEEGSEDYEMDMTGASDEDVIKVYKKLSGEDEIEVVSPNEVVIKDPVSGAEYNVKMGGGDSLIDQGEMDIDGEIGIGDSDDAEMDMEPEMGPEMGAELEMGDDSVEAEFDAESDETVKGEEDEEEEEEEMGESVVYEVELSEDDEIAEDIVRGKGHDKELVNSSAPNTGDIEGQKAPNDKDSGDNLVGGFKDDAQNGTGDNHAAHIMEMEDDEMNEGDEEVIDEEVIDESIPKGSSDARRVPGQARVGQPVGTGAKHVPGVAGGQYESIVKKYNALLAEAKKIKVENDTFRASMNGFRKMLGETAVFNSNLTYVTKLFLEHSTTSAEKKQILDRFDNEVGTIDESKKLYKSIASELGAKTPIYESVEKRIVSAPATSQSSQLNETKVYVDPAQKRIIDLMNRTQNR